MARAINPTLVGISTRFAFQPDNGNRGTGLVLAAGGLILTNNHVIAGAGAITVTEVGQRQHHPAEALGTSIAADIAVLQLRPAAELRPTVLGNSDDLSVGDTVYAFGDADGRRFTTGTVRAFDQATLVFDPRSGTSRRMAGLIEIDALLEHGSSGGPVVNRFGQVVGMVAAGDRAASGTYRGFAIPINRAVALADQILAGRPVPGMHIGPAGSLGVETAPTVDLPGDLRRRAAIVSRVLPASPASYLGLRPGCRIVSLSGLPVLSAVQFIDILHGRSPGETVSLRWVDHWGNQRVANVTLVRGPPQ